MLINIKLLNYVKIRLEKYNNNNNRFLSYTIMNGIFLISKYITENKTIKYFQNYHVPRV